MQIKRQGLLIALVICLIASMSSAAAFSQAWNSGTGQPRAVTSDGVDLFSANGAAVVCVSPTGSQLWSVPHTVTNNGNCMKAGKYVFLGEDNNVVALNKTTGATKWTATSPLGEGQTPKYILVKGAYVIVSNDAKVVILNREDASVATNVTDAATTSQPLLFGGLYIGGTSSGIQAYNAIMMPDLRISSITKTSNSTTAKIENIGLGIANKVLIKWVVRKTDGTYRTIHQSAGTINAGESKNITITGDFSKGYAIVDPYYTIPELNENNNQRYFS